MALVQQMNGFGSNHPGLNFLGGLVAGMALTAAATFGALTMQSEPNVEAAGISQVSISDDWDAPRVLISTLGAPSQASDDVLAAPRISGGRTFSFAAAETEEQTLSAPRVPVGTVGTPVQPLGVSVVSVAPTTGGETLDTPRVLISSFGSDEPRLDSVLPPTGLNEQFRNGLEVAKTAGSTSVLPPTGLNEQFRSGIGPVPAGTDGPGQDDVMSAERVLVE